MKRLYHVLISYLTFDNFASSERFYVYARKECHAVNLCIKHIQESSDINCRIKKLLSTDCVIVPNFIK